MTKKINNPDLLPCPFCGGTDFVIQDDHAEDDVHHVYAYHVFCCDCHAHGRNLFPHCWCETEEQAIDAWNDRFVPATIPGKFEDRVEIDTDALLHINNELNHIVRTKEHIERLLTPIKMVK